jgi:multidrug resistance efflux pump
VEVAALTEGVLKTMLLSKLKIATAVLLLVVAALVGAAGLIYQTQAGESKGEKEKQPAAKSAEKPKADEDNLQGTPKDNPAIVEAFEQTAVHSRIAGIAAKIHVDIGDQVKKGQLLGEIAAPELKTDLLQKKALIKQAEVTVGQARRSLLAAEGAVATGQAKVREGEAGSKRADADLERWQAELKRVSALADSNVVDRQVVDEVRSKWEAAKAAREEAQAKLKVATAVKDEIAARRVKVQADLHVAEAGLEVAKADAQRVELMQQHLQIRAPFGGVVVRRNAATGDMVTPFAGGKTPALFVLARTDMVRVVVKVAEADIPLLKKDAKAVIRFPLKKQQVEARVTRTAWVLDPKTRTKRVEIDLPNSDGKILPGMYGTVSFPSAGDSKKTNPPAKGPDQLQMLLKARRDAARKGYEVAVESMQKTRRAENQIFLLGRSEDVYTWSVRWLNAERGWIIDAKYRKAALESHLKRMKALQLRVAEMHKSGVAPLLDVTAAEFYRAEAEVWLALEQSK